MIGFFLGYVIGTRSGEKGWEELQDAWTTISSSDEVRDLLAGGFAMAKEAVRHGAGLMAERLNQEDVAGLRRAA
jgi:hypothetical protein